MPVTFSEKQRIVLNWWRPQSRYHDREAIVCDGAVRSGKTLCMGLSFFLWACTCFRGARFGICGKTIASLRRNVLAELLPKLRAIGFSVREKRAENLVQVGYRGRSNDFYIFGGRDESSCALIQGITFAGILLDEAALMPRSFVEQACALLRHGKPPLVQLQSGGAAALVLQRVDSGRGGAQLPAPALYHAGQSLPLARHPPAVCAPVFGRVLPALRAGTVGCRGGAGV